MAVPPMVRLTVDYMRHEIVQAFSTHTAEIQRAVENAVAQAVATFNFDQEVRTIADSVLHEMIRDGIRNSLLWNAEVRAAIARSLGEPPEDKLRQPLGKKRKG